ncbi:hypothetical protein F5Y08DRAFT_304572 [Xylaria arbuscula]|nr:hypothetical protein F5Y08DRAFT_304572 [Xylaria arbuscula]
MSVVNKHPLRKSCTFCRARKIKCSNETICEACRKQSVDCVYDFEPYHRPSGSSNTYTDNSVSANETINVQTEDRTSISPYRDAQTSSGVSPDTGSIQTDREAELAFTASDYIGPLLEAMYADNFLTEHDGMKSTSWQRKIGALHRSVGSLRPLQTSSSSKGSQVSRYASMWACITKDLVECVIGKFGSLGCHQGEGGGSKPFINGLQMDDTASMFDREDLTLKQAETDILGAHCSRKTAQTIDIWFSNHPLSFLISKTLLIHELRAATHNELLLAVMLADSYGFIGDEVAAARSRSLLHFTTSKLQGEALDLSTASTSFSSQSAFQRRISTTQALILLVWNALCRSEIRRATCYISLASRIANHIMTQKWSSTTSVPGGRVNGIEVSEVIKETMAYLWCTCFKLSLWLSTQVQEVSHLPHNMSASAFLPVAASSSILISLDEASDNFSTLQKQKMALTDAWPVAHVSTVIGYIYALYPQEDQHSRKTGDALWQESTLLALQRIQEPSSVQTFRFCLSRDISSTHGKC